MATTLRDAERGPDYDLLAMPVLKQLETAEEEGSARSFRWRGLASSGKVSVGGITEHLQGKHRHARRIGKSCSQGEKHGSLDNIDEYYSLRLNRSPNIGYAIPFMDKQPSLK